MKTDVSMDITTLKYMDNIKKIIYKKGTKPTLRSLFLSIFEFFYGVDVGDGSFNIFKKFLHII